MACFKSTGVDRARAWARDLTKLAASLLISLLLLPPGRSSGTGLCGQVLGMPSARSHQKLHWNMRRPLPPHVTRRLVSVSLNISKRKHPPKNVVAQKNDRLLDLALTSHCP